MTCLMLRFISKLDFELTQYRTIELTPGLQFDHQVLKDTRETSRKADKSAIYVIVLIC